MTREEHLAICEEVCDRVLRGHTLKDIFNPDVPGVGNKCTARTWAKWCKDNPAIGTAFYEALQARQLIEAQSILEIADNETLEPDSRRVRIDARKWLAERLHRALFGAKVDVEHKGGVTLTLNKSDADVL